MKQNRLTLFCFFFFCCLARTLYGQQDSAAQKIQYGAVPAAVDTAGSEESLQLLDEVVIRKRFAVRMDKDTTFFAADSFTARKFDNLEELMRRIPGIRVAQDGSILYNGIPVKQVGIDGAPLVQMNPQKLLQLLRGRDVEELKIYTLETAVNQPCRFNERQEKGLDIRLKEAARHGYYGKLAAGTGSGAVAQWDQAADLSSFTADRKISAFIQSANTADQSAFAASELKGQAPGSLPRGRAANYTGGIYYDQKIGKKLSVGGYYSISRNTQHLQQQTKERSFLPSGQINTDAQSASESRMLTNTVSLQAAYSPDSVSQISLMLSAGTSSSGGAQQAYTSASNEAALPLSASRLSSSTTTQNPNAAGTLSCSRSFGSAGSLSSSFAANLSHSKARAEQSADIALLNSATAQQVRQQQYESESGSNYHWTTAYQYPVSRQFSISASWMSAWALSGTARDAYDRYPNAAGQLTDSLNALYSSRYRLRNITNAAAATLMFSGKKYKARLGGEFRHLAQQGIGLSAVQERSFKNLVPAAHVALSLSRQSVLNIAYTAQLMQPDMNKIRPLLNNADPMNIVIGNPQLTQSLAHNTHAGYSYTTANGARSLQASGSLSVIRKAISLEQYTDAEGRRTSRYYNQDGNYTTNVSLDYEQSLGNHIRCSAGPSAGFSRTITRINKETSTALSPLFGFRTALQYNKDTLLNIRLDAAASTVATRSALHAGQRARAQSFSGTMNIQYRFPQGRLSLGSACSWNYLRGSLGSGNSFVVWNVSVQREMNKEQSLVLKLYVYDLLNRSKGYLAYNEQNIQREERFISLQRFFLLGLIWHFTKR